MSFAVGEVREFATGVMEAVPHPGLSGVWTAKMQTIQKIWDGERWLAQNEEGADRALASAGGYELVSTVTGSHGN
jgi:hypothetical protein